MKQTIENLLTTGDFKMDLSDFQRLAELGENRFIEKKSIRLLDSPKVNKDKIKELLGKEICAFANYEGGILLLGINDKTNMIEEGVSNTFEKTTLKEWLEDILFIVVNPSLNNYAIKTIEKDGKTLYAIVIAPSSLAPHQCSINNVYYGRIDGKSRPLNGLMVKDIFSRKEKTNIFPTIDFRILHFTNPSFCILKIGILNNSNVCADNVLAIISVDSPENVMNGGYNEGKSYLRNNSGELYADLVYPNVNQLFKGVGLFTFDRILFTIKLVARNFPLTKFSYTYEHKNGEIEQIHD